MNKSSIDIEISDIIKFDSGSAPLYRAFVRISGVSMGKERHASGFAYTREHDATDQDWVNALYNPMFI